MGDHNNNWGTSEFNHHQVGLLDVPKFKSAQPPSLPLSPSPASPSSYLAFSSAFSPSEFFNSSLFSPSPNVSYKLSHAHKLLWFGFMLWGIANCGGFFCVMCVVLDFCISYYWAFGWPDLQLEERFRRRTTTWQGGWEKLLGLLFPNSNSIFLRHVSSGEHCCFLSPFDLNKYYFLRVFLVNLWSSKTLGGRFLFSFLLFTYLDLFLMLFLQKFSLSWIALWGHFIVFNGPLYYFVLLC